MKAITMYKAIDGELFPTEYDCKKYERDLEEAEAKSNIIFFNSWGSQVKRYDIMQVDYIYIPSEEYEFAKNLLKRHNRELVSESPSNFYYGYNMAVYPIERKFEKQVAKLEEAKKEFERDQKLFRNLQKKVLQNLLTN